MRVCNKGHKIYAQIFIRKNNDLQKHSESNGLSSAEGSVKPENVHKLLLIYCFGLCRNRRIGVGDRPFQQGILGLGGLVGIGVIDEKHQ